MSQATVVSRFPPSGTRAWLQKEMAMVRLYSFTEHTVDLKTSEDLDNFSEQAIAVSRDWWTYFPSRAGIRLDHVINNHITGGHHVG